MSDITIKPQVIKQNKKYITVDKPGVKKLKNSSIVFKNKLDDSPEARLTFYDIDDKGGTAITDFCKNQAESYFVVPGKKKGEKEEEGNGMATCELTKLKGAFAYSIETEPAIYEPLDPIIIIEPSNMPDMTQPTGGKSLPFTPVIVGVLIGAAIMYVLTRTIFAKNN